jgi:hypothetical protein
MRTPAIHRSFSLECSRSQASLSSWHAQCRQGSPLAEYSRNLVFTVGGRMDHVFQALIDRTRSRMDLRTVKTILGYQRRPRYRPRRGQKAPSWKSPSRDLCTV